MLERVEQVLAVMEADLLFEGDKTYVEVETGERQFERREVKTGLSDSINIEIVEGLTYKERIKKQ